MIRMTLRYFGFGLATFVLIGSTCGADAPVTAITNSPAAAPPFRQPAPRQGLRLPDMPVHDPWILAHEESKTYYLYTAGQANVSGTNRSGTVTYKSKNLRDWDGPYVVFTVPDGIWASPTQGAWAPEVHRYRGKYYLFVTLHNSDRVIDRPPDVWRVTHMRGTIIAVADSPEGPFTPLKTDGPVPPADFMTLDGTLYIEDAVPWMVYAHEWIQMIDGMMEAIPLKPDLSAAAGDPIHLFKASDAPWINAQRKPSKRENRYVTDGPELFRAKTGQLLMLWSSYDRDGYVQTVARSESGKLAGPWKQLDPLVGNDSGHGMLFKTFDGQLMMVLHQPFHNARGKLFDMEDTGDNLKVVRPRHDLDGGAAVEKPTPSGKLAPRPLYRDPPFDAPTDPVLCFNAEQKKWFMYYTARRATATNAPGVTWVHGSNIGMAESSDGGATWIYRGIADISYGKDEHPNDYTYWAPEVIWHNGTYHMYLSYVPGIFTDWNHPREIVHLTSKDGVKWDTVGKVDLKSERVIDPCVIQLPNSTWRMWYKDERAAKPLSYADSPDLYKWETKGTAVTDFSGEGPKVIHWKGKYWLIADCWRNGMRVWNSDDCLNWKLQEQALFGSHGDVVISGDRAWWFYFGGPRSAPSRTTAINVVELSVVDGKLIPGDPDQPTYIDLKPVREEEK